MNVHGTSPAGRNPLPALAAAICLAAFYALVASSVPGLALRAFFLGPLSSRYAFFSLLGEASPLLLAALGASLAFKAGVFNLGGEGQAALGGLVAALVLGAAASRGLWPPFAIAIALVAAAISSALLACLSAAAERFAGAETLLTSFLFSQAVLLAVDWAVAGPLRDPGSNLLAMPPIPKHYLLPRLAPPSPLDGGALIALGLALAFAFLLGRTRIGYELRLYGANPLFARVQGLSPALAWWPLATSGALHGLAGALLVMGSSGRAVKGLSGGVAWNGIAVALVAGTEPLFTLPASLFFAWLDLGARASALFADLSPDASAIMKAAVLFLVTARPRSKPRGPGRARKTARSRPRAL